MGKLKPVRVNNDVGILRREINRFMHAGSHVLIHIKGAHNGAITFSRSFAEGITAHVWWEDETPPYAQDIMHFKTPLVNEVDMNIKTLLDTLYRIGCELVSEESPSPVPLKTTHYQLSHDYDAASCPVLTIVRGLPGSGKSTYAHNLAAETGVMLIEPDALLVRGGVYDYTEARYYAAVRKSWCMVQHAAEGRADVVYVDVLSRLIDVKYVISWYANQDGYGVTVVDMPLLTVKESMARNKHNVRREDVERMARDWEPWKGAD